MVFGLGFKELVFRVQGPQSGQDVHSGSVA